MGYTNNQAKVIAEQIYKRFGYKIFLACQSEGIEESFVAAFIGVEAGKDRLGQFVESATRFEKHVFVKLKALRDGLRSSYQGVKQTQIKTASDDALRNLATSYGLTQIMGWHLVNNLKGTINDLRNPEKHLHFTIDLLKLVGGSFLRRRDYGSVLRIWNTGSANGKTYHASYVSNALKVKAAYETILKQNPPFKLAGKEIEKVVSKLTESATVPTVYPSDTSKAEIPETTEGVKPSNKSSEQTPANTTTEQSSKTKIVVKDGDVKVETEEGGDDQPPQKVAIEKPEPKNFISTIRMEISALVGGNIAFQAIVDGLSQIKAIGLSQTFWLIVGAIALVGSVIYLLYRYLDFRSDTKRDLELTNNLIRENSTPENQIYLVSKEQIDLLDKNEFQIITR